MIKAHYILFILFCGFLLNPMDSYGCNSSEKTSSKKTCCELNMDSQQNNEVEKSCCKSSKSEKKSCDGSCNNSNCSLTIPFSCIISNFPFKAVTSIELIVSPNTNFFYLEKNILTHYFSIWCPPKIS
ncbi:MAG: hypothetical protein ACI924_000107 [Flavobacterium sp.]|jgi:hypothetical protein